MHLPLRPPGWCRAVAITNACRDPHFEGERLGVALGADRALIGVSLDRDTLDTFRVRGVHHHQVTDVEHDDIFGHGAGSEPSPPTQPASAPARMAVTSR